MNIEKLQDIDESELSAATRALKIKIQVATINADKAVPKITYSIFEAQALLNILEEVGSGLK